MNILDFRRLYAYTDWANERMLTAIGSLSDEQFNREIPSSFPSIQKTLSHIASAEWVWLERWNGSSPSRDPNLPDSPAFDIIATHLRDVASRRRDYLAGLTAGMIDTPLSYRATSGDPFTMRLGDVLFHCANHSTYHRGQLVTMLRQAGAVPPNMDYTTFARSDAYPRE